MVVAALARWGRMATGTPRRRLAIAAAVYLAVATALQPFPAISQEPASDATKPAAQPAASDAAKPAAPSAATSDANKPAAAPAAKSDAKPASTEPASGTATPASVHRAKVDGPITPATVDYLRGAMESARVANAAALVIVLDTPGGLLDSTKLIVQDLLAAPLPVFVYVSPGGASATSAGVFVTMAAHVAGMAPGTSIGAAHPVGGQGEDIKGDMRKKMENFVAAFGSAIAERRGRNVEWAEKAVRESVTATETEAVANRIVDFVAADLAEFLSKANGREVEVAGKKVELKLLDVLNVGGQPRVVDVEMTLRQRVVAFVSNPNIAYLLMMAGMLGLYIEMNNPGLVLPGVVGAICLLLALLAAQVLPISSTGALLLAVGMAFLVAEMFLPSFGALGLGGIAALALGSLFLYTPESALMVDRRLVAGVVATMGAFVALVLGVLVSDRRRRPHTGSEGMIGEVGVAIDGLQPRGIIKLHGEIWNAVSSVHVAAGGRVRVVRVRGLEAEVVPLEEDAPGGTP